jgi:hypothetical protein
MSNDDATPCSRGESRLRGARPKRRTRQGIETYWPPFTAAETGSLTETPESLALQSAGFGVRAVAR